MSYKYLTCGKNFENNFKLLDHEKRRCKSKKCADCGAVFQKVDHLERHRRSKKRIVCDCCQKTFCSTDHQQQHLRTVWKSNNKDIKDLNQQINPASGYEKYNGFKKTITRERF